MLGGNDFCIACETSWVVGHRVPVSSKYGDAVGIAMQDKLGRCKLGQYAIAIGRNDDTTATIGNNRKSRHAWMRRTRKQFEGSFLFFFK